MSETPGGTETVSPIPHGDERPDKRPGYPPAGQAEALAAIKAQEAAEDTDPGSVNSSKRILQTYARPSTGMLQPTDAFILKISIVTSLARPI
jgi:hypothetical protein